MTSLKVMISVGHDLIEVGHDLVVNHDLEACHDLLEIDPDLEVNHNLELLLRMTFRSTAAYNYNCMLHLILFLHVLFF